MPGAIFFKGFMGVTLFNPHNNLRGSIISLEMEKLRPREFGQLPRAQTASYCTDLWGPTKIMQVKLLGTIKCCTRRPHPYYYYSILQNNPNELFGQPNIISNGSGSHIRRTSHRTTEENAGSGSHILTWSPH